MTVKSGFFNSSNGDRKYDALDMSSIFDGVIIDGVFATIGKLFAVTPGSGLQVLVDTGKAWFDHTWTINDAILPLTIEAPDITMDRYDVVVLETNSSDPVRENSIKIVKGSPSSSPQIPQLTNTENVHQHPLAYVKVIRSSTSILKENIEILVGRGECPFVTGPLETVPIDELFSRREAERDTWFEEVQSQLSGDVAGNLLKEIRRVDKKVDDHWDDTLKSVTKKLLGLPDDAVPDDAFAKLVLGGNTGYIFSVTVKDPKGVPKSGMTVSGLKTIVGQPATTDENGIFIGSSESENPTISVLAPYPDWKPISKQLQQTDVITNVDAQFEFNEDPIIVNSSTQVDLSDYATTVDLCAAAAGGGGSSMQTNAFFYGGVGGGGGRVKNLLNHTLIGKKLIFEIGAGGYGGTSDTDYGGGNGGNTRIKAMDGTVLCEAEGGKGGQWVGYGPDIKDNDTIPGGVGNGAGGNCSWSETGSYCKGGTGVAGSVHVFDDPELDTPGGGGAGGYSESKYLTTKTPGKPGGYGGQSRQKGNVPGGGGGGGVQSSSGGHFDGGAGGNGRAYYRVHHG